MRAPIQVRPCGVGHLERRDRREPRVVRMALLARLLARDQRGIANQRAARRLLIGCAGRGRRLLRRPAAATHDQRHGASTATNAQLNRGPGGVMNQRYPPTSALTVKLALPNDPAPTKTPKTASRASASTHGPFPDATSCCSPPTKRAPASTYSQWTICGTDDAFAESRQTQRPARGDRLAGIVEPASGPMGRCRNAGRASWGGLTAVLCCRSSFSH